MVAIVSGNGFGLSTGSAATLGQAGVFGNPNLGNNKEGAYVNAASGNLVLQDQDDFIAALGTNLSLTRTYNSQGGYIDGNRSGWRMGPLKQLTDLTGTVNTAGSTITRINNDGSRELYRYDAARAQYLSTDGGGGYNHLSLNASQEWVWTADRADMAGLYENYGTLAAGGRIQSSGDQMGARISYQYDGSGLLSQVTDASGDVTRFDYVNGNLSQIRVTDRAGVTSTRVHYSYDALNRLIQVSTDLTPDDNSIADGKLYATTYTYLDNTNEVASVTQSDGTRLAFGYKQVGGDWKIDTVTDGLGQVTRYAYANQQTTVTDPLGNNTVYTYDAAGQLLTVTAPATLLNGAVVPGQLTTFAYDANGNVLSVTDARGKKTTYEYDANGNRTRETNQAGDTITRRYDLATNRLLKESIWPSGTSSQLPLITEYVYDARNNLRFIVTPQSHVTEYQYDANGLRANKIEYSASVFPSIVGAKETDKPLTEAQLIDWSKNLTADASAANRTDYGYDARGLVNKISTYAYTRNSPATPATEVFTTQYVYDQHGQLLQTIDGKTQTSTLFAYDGLGRLISAADAANNTTVTAYDDVGGSRSVTLSNGLVTKTTYDRAGHATSVSQLDKDGHVLSIATNSYDNDGQLRRTAAPNGAAMYFLYDDAGRQTAKVDANGDLTAYFYNADGQVSRTIQYARPLTPAQLNQLAQVNGNWPRVSLADLHVADNDADNRSSWNLYDDAGRLSKSVDASGLLTVYVYDQAGRVTQQIRRAYDISKLANVYVPATLADAPTADDQVSRNFYTADGKLQLEIDPAGYVTEHRYDALGRLIETLNYATQLTAAYLSQAPAASAIIAGAGAVASHQRYFYNAKDQLAGTLDNGNYLTELKYDANGNLLSRRHYAVAVTAPGGARMSDLGYAAGPSDLVTSYTYTARNQLETETAPGGIVTRYTYDKLGKLIETRVGTGTTRAQAERYDLQGRLIGELNAEGVAALASAKPEDVDGIWLRYGTRYTYNENGLRLTATDQLGNQSRYYYDGQGNLSYTINAAGEVTALAYNGFNQLKSKTSYGTRIDAATLATLGGGQNDANIDAIAGQLAVGALDSVTRYEYDHNGRQSAVVDALGNRSTVHYDAFGRVDATEQQNVPNGNVSAPAANPGGRNFYDLDGRLTASLTSGGALTAYTYNALGQLTDRITYAKPVSFTVADLNAAMALVAPDAAHDSHQRYFYDARGLLAAEMRAEGLAADGKVQWSVTKRDYDGNGNLIMRTAYATPLSAAGGAPALAYPAVSASDSLTLYAYDSANRLASTASTQFSFPSKSTPRYCWSVVSNTYDALGNLSATTAYARPYLGPAGNGTQLLRFVAASADDAVTYYTYDSANRIKTVAVAQNNNDGHVQWAVSSRSYDAAGNLSSLTQYATPQVTASPGTYPAMAPVAVADNDRTTSYRYDALNRVQLTIDATGAVTRLDYDARGNVTQRTAYNTPVAAPNTVTATYNPAPQPADRITRTIYDLDNRPVYSIDALGQVTEQRYDAHGNLAATLQYAAALKPDQLATLTPQTADIKNLLVLTPGVDRLTRYSYDQQGRLRYTVDAAGYLKETVYNTLGQVSSTREYLAPPAAAFADPLTPDALTAEANRQNKSVAVHSYTYDATGNLLSSTDPLNNTERYTYDGQGRKLTFINKANNTWTYEYDAAGHMVSETSPQVANYVADFAVAMGAWTALPQQALITMFEYDMFGNLLSRTEASGSSQERTTTYRYDLAGRQTLTILSGIKVYDEAADPKSTAGTANAFEKDSGDRVTTVRYNAFGDAVSNQDAAGNISYKVYDQHGQVRYDIDAMGYVTGYARNSFGEVTDLTRYNTPAQAGTPTPDQLGAKDFARRVQADPNNDRTLSTNYDLLGRVIRSSEPLTDVYDQLSKTGPYIRAAKTTDTAFDRFGQVRAQSVYGASAADAAGNRKRLTLASETRNFYDLRGNLKAQVSALSSSADGHTGTGYFTTYAYAWDGSNRTVTQTEYSQSGDWDDTRANGGAPPSAPSDTNRTTKSVYDLANRLSSQSKVGAKFFRDGAEVTGDIKTAYYYDALGNQVLAVDALGGQVYTYYDQLGRVIAIAKAQLPGVAEITAAAPSLTEFKLDLLGNTAVRIDYAGITGNPPGIGAPPAGDAGNGYNRVTMTHYNLDGRAVEVLDPEQFGPTNPRPAGVPVSVAHTSYDALGHAVKQWRTVSARNADDSYTTQTTFQIARYDSLGRIKETETPPLADLVDNTSRPNVVKSNAYNAFGEVIGTYVTDASGMRKQVTSTKYDQAGRAWYSNGVDGVDTVTLFNAQGQATAQIRSATTDQARVHELADVANAMAARNVAQQLRTDTQYDLLGNVIDSSAVNELNTVLVWFNGAWVQVPSSYDRPAIDSLIVIGRRDDAGKTIEVQYRLKPDGAWVAAGADRVQWLDGTPVFSTGGMASGDYEYQVKMTPVGSSSYQSRMGSMHIAEVDTTAKNSQVVALYLMLMGRAPDPATLNRWVGKYNLGATLSQLAGEIFASAEASTRRGNDNGTAIQQMLATIGRPLPSDAGYQAKLDLWTGKLNQATTPAARGQVIRALLDDAGTALDARTKAVTNYLLLGGSDADAAARLLTLADSTPDGAIAESVRLAKAETQRVQLARLYLALLGRAPDKGGFDYWINDLSNGKTLESIALSMMQDKEALALGLSPTLTPASYNEKLVQLAYLNLLGRMPTPAELSTETAALGQATPPTAAHASFIVGLCNRVANDNSGDAAAQAARTMLFDKVTVCLAYAATPSPGLSTEQIVAANKAAIDAMYSAGTAADAAHKATLQLQALALAAQAAADATRAATAATPLETLRLQLARVYAVVLNRAPDSGGYAFWVNVLKSGRPGTMLDIVNDMLSHEGQNSALYPSSLSDKDFVTRVFTMGLGLQPGSAALASAVATWVPAAANTTRGQLMLNIINAVASSTKPDEQAMRSLLNNKAAVGITYALNFGSNDLAQGGAILSKVTSTDISAAIAFGNSIGVQVLINEALAASTAAATAAAQAAASADGLGKVNAAQANLNTLLAAASGNALVAPLVRAAQLYVVVLSRGAPGQPGLDLGGITAMSLQMRDGMTDVAAIQSMMDKTPPTGYDAGKFVKQLYVQALGLDPAKDPDGVAKWTAAAALPENRAQVIAGLLKSFLEDPIADTYAGKRDIQLAQAQFHNNISRVLEGLSTQIGQAESAYAIAKDADAKASSAATAAKALSDITASTTDPKALAALELSRFYVGILNRGAPGQLDIDVGGLNFWTRAYIQGTDPVDIARQMLEKATFPTDKVAFVKQMYQQVWGREPGADSNRWVSKLISNSTAMGYASVAVGIIRELVNTPVSTELDYRLKGGFDARVRDAMQTAAQNAASEAARAATDLSTKGGLQQQANQTLETARKALNAANALTVDGDWRVVSASSLADTGTRVKNSVNLKPGLELMVILGMPTDFSSFYPVVMDTNTGDTLLKDILASANLPSVKNDTERASFFQYLYNRMLHRDPDVSPGKVWPTGNWWYANTVSVPFDSVDKAWQFLAGARKELYTPTIPPYKGIAQRLNFQTEFNTAYDSLMAEVNRRIDNYPAVRQAVADDISRQQDAAKTAYTNAGTDAATANTNYNYAWSYNEVAKVAGTTLSRAIQVQTAAATVDVTAADSIAAQARMRDAALSVGLASNAKLIDFKTVADTAAVLRSAIGSVKSLEAGRGALASANVVRTDAVQAAAGASPLSKQVRAVTEVYTALLKRSPTFLELNQGLNSLKAGKSLEDITVEVLNRNQDLYPKLTISNDAFVTKAYTAATGHAPDNATLRTLSDALTSAPESRGPVVMTMVRNLSAGGADSVTFNTQVASNLNALSALAQNAGSPDQAALTFSKFIQDNSDAARAEATTFDAAAQAAMPPAAKYVTQITQLYLVLFNRAPEAAAITSAVYQLSNGTPLEQIVRNMVESKEFRSLSNYEFASRLYTIGFGRPGALNEIARAADTLNTGVKRERLVIDLINELSNYAGSEPEKTAARTALAINVAASLERSIGETASFVGISQLAAQRNASIESSALLARMSDGVLLGHDSVVDSLDMRNAASITRDRWGNVLSVTDARDRNYKVNYRYNLNNQQISQSLNARDGDANVALSTIGYDALGRQVRSGDFVGNALGRFNRRAYDSNGNVITETHADGGVVSYTYNLFGDRMSVTTQRGDGQTALQTSYTYDHLGHMLSSASAAVVNYTAPFPGQLNGNPVQQLAAEQLIQRYFYDELGRNIVRVNAAGFVTQSIYDFDGNVVATVNEAGARSYSSYDTLHHRVGTLDAEGYKMRWNVDVHGQLSSSTDMSGTVTNYQYDAAGRKIHQDAQRATLKQDIDYVYENGLLTEVRDRGTHVTTRYTYDRVGNRLTEKQVYDSAAFAPPKARVQDNTITYDMQNRVASIKDADYTLSYEYDNNGNRTYVTSDFIEIIPDHYEPGPNPKPKGDSDGSVWVPATSVPRHLITYNDYDVMNRQLKVNWAVTVDGNGNRTGMAMGVNGHELRYDYAGNRRADSFSGVKITKDDVNHTYVATAAHLLVTETYDYDQVDRLVRVNRDGIAINDRRYDKMGRLTETGILTTADYDGLDKAVEAAGGSSATHIYGYNDALGHLLEQWDGSYNRFNPEDRNSITSNTWIGSDGYDKAGNLISYEVRPAGSGHNTKYTIRYNHTDSAKEASISVEHGATNTSNYDANDNRFQVTSYDNDKSTVMTSLWYDADGHVLSKHDGAGDHFSLIVNGQVIGEETNSRNDVLGSSYAGVTSSMLSAPPSTYSVLNPSETLRSVAQAIWGDNKLWYLIADANGLSSDSKLSTGQILRIPERVNTLHNDYATFKPYDASEAVGNTTPALPPPSHGGGCGTAGKILMVVVAVAVTYFTAGMLASLGPVLSTAIGAAAGSVASQGVGIAIGAQDGFSWSGVALAAVAGGVTGGVAQLSGTDKLLSSIGGQSWGAVAARAALSNVVSQGIGNIAGLQHGFSWANVAASAIGAAVGSQVGEYLNKNEIFGPLQDSAAQLARATASGFSAGLSTAIARGGKIAVAQIATDAFGNALGSSLADSLNGDGRILSPRPISNFSSIAPVEWKPKEVDYSALNAAGIVKANDYDAEVAKLDLEPSVDDMNGAPQKRILEPQRTADGKVIKPPTDAELNAELRLHPHDFMDKFTETAAFYKGHISVNRDDINRTLTLVGRGSIYGPLSFIAAADGMDKWDNLSYKDSDGYTYKSDVKFTITQVERDADVRLNYGIDVQNTRQHALPNGNIYFLNSDMDGLRPGMPAHELGHAFFGVKDAYFDLVMPNHYILPAIPYNNFNDSLMGDLHGIIRGPDLKALTLKYEESQIKYFQSIKK